MAYNGAGVHLRVMSWATDRSNGITMQASRVDTEADDFSTSLSLCLLKDGQSTPIANIGWGGFKLTNLGDATNATDALNRQTGDARYPAVVATTTDNAATRFNGTTGAQQDSGLVIDDSGDIHPATHDTGALGTDALRFADLFLASGAVITWGAASAADVTLTHSANALAFAGASSGYSFDAAVTLPNTGLRLLDTNASHGLTVKPGSDLTGEKTLTVTTGDNDRTLDISAANTTVSAYGATLVDDADAATARGTLGLAATTTDNAVIRADGTTGGTQNSGVIVDDSNNITGAASFASSSAALTAQLSAQSTDATNGAWTAAVLYRNSATPAASDNLASLIFRGRDSGAADADYAQIRALILDPTDGSEDGQLVLGALVGGVNTNIITLGPGVQIGTPTGGDKGAGSLNTTTLYQNNVQVATLGANSFTAQQSVSASSVNFAPLLLESTDGGASVGPIADLHRNSASPAASDVMGQFKFSGRDSAANYEEYASLSAVIVDPTSTSEDAYLSVNTVIAGTLAERLRIGAGLYTSGATGGDKGADTINMTEYYRAGTAIPALDSGTYTPTLTGVTNIAASTASVCHYMRVGSVVTVSGTFSVDPTAAANSELGISLPIASDFSGTNQCGGTASTSAATTDNSMAIIADTVNNRATVKWLASDTANHAVSFQFTYRVI